MKNISLIICIFLTSFAQAVELKTIELKEVDVIFSSPIALSYVEESPFLLFARKHHASAKVKGRLNDEQLLYVQNQVRSTIPMLYSDPWLTLRPNAKDDTRFFEFISQSITFGKVKEEHRHLINQTLNQTTEQFLTNLIRVYKQSEYKDLVATGLVEFIETFDKKKLTCRSFVYSEPKADYKKLNKKICMFKRGTNLIQFRATHPESDKQSEENFKAILTSVAIGS